MSDDHSDRLQRPCWTIVLTGASGYLGQHCLRALIDSHRSTTTKNNKPTTRHVHALVHQLSKAGALNEAIQTYIRNSSSNNSLNDVVVTVTALDITSAPDCQAWAESLPNTPDCCIHTAALSSPTVCEEQPSLAAAVNVPKHFLSQLYQSNPGIRMIAISTDQVYDGHQICSKGDAYTEESPTNPCNVYGTTKVQLEDYLLSLYQEQKQRFPESTLFLLRSSILLGPLAPFVDAHSTFLHFIANQAATTTTYYTNERRSVLAVADAVRVILHLATYDPTSLNESSNATVSIPSGVFCMGGPDSVSRYDMAVAALHYLGKEDVASLAVPAVKAAAAASTSTTTPTNNNHNHNNNCETKKKVPSSPLDITMDSSKLLRQVMGDTTQKFATLTEIVASTFGVPSQPM